MNQPINWSKFIFEDSNSAMSYIYKEYKGSFVNWIRHQSNCSYDQAHDIFQESLTILFENVIQGKAENLTYLKSYLFSIGKNKLQEHYRYQKKYPTKEIDAELILKSFYDPNVEEGSEAAKQIQQVMRALEIIGDPCKTLILEYYYNGYNLDEISKSMNYKNRNTTKTKKFKCMTRLRKVLKEIQ